jgi:hypothetical protein
MAWKIGSYSESKGQLTKTLSAYLGLGAAQGLRGIDHFDLRAAFLAGAVAGLDLITAAALDARLTSVFFATGDDFIVRTVIRENRTGSSSFAKRKRQEFETAVSALIALQLQKSIRPINRLVQFLKSVSVF